MRVHWEAGIGLLGTLCGVFIGQEPLPRASTWHHIHPTHRKATEITDDAGHLRGRTRFVRFTHSHSAFFALTGTKIKDISSDALRFGESASREVGGGLCSDFHFFVFFFVNGDESCVKICSSHFREELSLSHLLAGGVGFTRGHLLWHWVWKSWRILLST